MPDAREAFRAIPGWLPLLVLPPVAGGLAWSCSGWILMWALAFAICAGCKWLTWKDGANTLGRAARGRSWGYLFFWPGMDGRKFLDERLRPARPGLGEWAFALGKTVLGAGLLWGVMRYLPADRSLLRGWTGMVGLMFVLHFGLFHLCALAWQRAGVTAEPIMHAPIVSQSLGEFWGRRWNRGFNDIVQRHVFRPSRRRLGVTGATMLTFLASGLLHDVAISVPARFGYGWPAVYFLLQGACLLFERSYLGRKLGLRHGLRGWLFTIVVTVAPAGVLFPPAFIERVMLPFFRAIGAL